MEIEAPAANSKASFLDAIAQRAHDLYIRGAYQESLDLYLQITQSRPDLALAWHGAAVCCVNLRRWQEALGYAQTALAHKHDDNNFALYDTLAHAYAALEQWDKARHYGLLALERRVRLFNGEPAIPSPQPGPMPPLPNAQTRQRNLIAFSLFGGDSKYCETAVLNVQEQPDVYPNWICRFYIDNSVPTSVINRLQKGGAQIVPVQGAAAQWPGPMWRFLALGDPQAHRILFRDADAVISRREATAVQQWLTSGKRFHIMRDWGSHTELMLAGLWDVVAGSLPPLEALMQRFLSAPLESRHFADQYFLRQYVWPYARASLMQHDSVFGFMDAVPFPDAKKHDDFHIGYAEGSSTFTLTTPLPNGTAVNWALFRTAKRNDEQIQITLVCAYPGVVKKGVVTAHIPVRYARWIQQGAAIVRLLEGDLARSVSMTL
ncbi:MAG: tetratricopeptide repeat protein [Burkholderiaceae bacterium]|nr:tetratricopeptide repeat protein [Burkholderiaceae bacterium]